MDRERRKLLWFGAAPLPATTHEFAARRLVWAEGDPARLPHDAEQACAAVLDFAPAVDDALLAFAVRDIARLVDHGLRVDIVAEGDAAMGRVQAALARFAGLPGVFFHTSPEPHRLAEAIARHDAGPVPRLDLEIAVEGGREELRKNDEILFQRAFAHCREIRLVQLAGGRSDARVFAVHMVVEGSNAGVWPQPAFAKLDRRDKIEREYANYRDYAARFIPFLMRPNIETLVCGSDRSLLVGNFVDHSESLRALAERGLAGPAITALFKEALAGWSDQAFAGEPLTGSIAEAMRIAGIWDPERIADEYVERAAEHGVLQTPADLHAALKGLDQRYRMAPVHGDLHGENVRVRGSHAILIDLSSVCRAPGCTDLAALETWFAFELASGDDPERYRDDQWKAVVDRLYAPAAFIDAVAPCRPTDARAWMATAVKHIRELARATPCCPGEYQTAVAVQLLRRCQWNDGPPGDRARRAHGYRLAAALVADLGGEKS